MIRYAFDSFSQLGKHLHLVDNASLMFLFDAKRAGATSGKVLVELEVRESAMKTVVRGEVVARAEGGIAGTWVQFNDARLAKRLQKPDAFAARRERRVSTEQIVQLRASSGVQLVAQMLDISAGGVRLRGATGVLRGMTYTLRLLGARPAFAELGRARAVRCEGQEAALQFTERGNEAVQRYLQVLQDEWARAPRLEHPKECCARMGRLEPALPKLRKQTAL
jgi:hypothetical protein